MRAVVQRVTQAQVVVDSSITGTIDTGLLIFLGIESRDTENDGQWLAEKIARLRIFEDAQGRMNRSVIDVAGGCLVVSQFTLFASTKKGTRPSFVQAAPPDVAIPLYEHFKAHLSQVLGKEVPSGIFGAHMDVSLTNDGPVTICIDTHNRE